MQVLEIFEGAPDCCISGTPSALARMSNRDSSSDQLFSGAVEISGDSELAHQLSRILGSMNIDWEEQLSRFTGDLIAHRIGNLFRTAQNGYKFRCHPVPGCSGVPAGGAAPATGRLEIEHFVGSVDTLRDDVERLQVRISLLQKRQAEVQ